ncbi:MAG: M48 family metalloprotease [Candidatus Acidiferrales bacterium]
MKHSRHKFGAVWIALVLCGFATVALAQAPCPGPPPIGKTANGNIFTEQQEMDLGDVISQQFMRDYHIVQDDQLNAYLNQIAQRLLAQMPPTQLKIRVVLVDIPVANAFTMPGGHIYVTRKLVAFLHSEDELAGVLGHELGHAVTHQSAAEVSRLFREGLGVTSVGDRADIFLKYNELIENVARKHLHFNAQDDKQNELVADSYGLYAMTRAGYSPTATMDSWNRLTQTEGKTGNTLTDLFGMTTPNEQRLRQMKKYVAELPSACVAPYSGGKPEEFRAWQQAVIAYTSAPALASGKESLPGLIWKRQLSPQLESEISNVKFSPDGKYLLAQDDFSVYVLTRNPLKPVFRIPTNEAGPADFTPDSQSVLISTPALHIEKWSIPSQKRAETYEVVIPSPCFQTKVSPDGSLVACIRTKMGGVLSFDLSSLQVATGTQVFEKTNFYSASEYDVYDLILSLLQQRFAEFFHIEFSPDGHYLAISRGLMALGWDLRSHQLLKLNGGVKELMSGGFVFLGSDRIVGINRHNPKASGAAAFPSGPIEDKVPLGDLRLYAPGHGDVVIVRPGGDFAVGVIDLKTGKGTLGSQMYALDVYDNVYSRPEPDGTIGIHDLKTRQLLDKVELPSHFIGGLEAAEVSPDLKWFAASGRTRGAVWNLETGERVFHVRGFSGCTFSSVDDLYADFPAYLKLKHEIGVLDPTDKRAGDGTALGDAQVAQIGNYLLYTRRAKGALFGPIDLEVHNVTTGATLWTKHFSDGIRAVSLSSSGNEMALITSLVGNEAKEEMKHNAQLDSQAKGISSKETAHLIQVIDPQSGTLQAEFAVDTGKGSFRISRAIPVGKWVAVTDTENRVLVYSPDGKLSGRLFGTWPAPSDSTGMIAVESVPDTVEIYNLATLTKEEEFAFKMPLAFYQFLDHGTKLFAVTEDQTAYLLSVSPPKSN